MTDGAVSAARGRACIVLAAVLWSTSGFFSKILTLKTPLGFHEPPVDPLVMAACRVFFAGFALVPFVRRSDITFRKMMIFTAISFAVMNATYISAMTLSEAGTAVLLQYTAPMWTYLIAVWILREPADRRGTIGLFGGLVGIGLILFSKGGSEDLSAVLLALVSGFTFALILIGLRVMRDSSSQWLTVVNLLFAALVLSPVFFFRSMPTGPQLLVLVVFGSLQLGFPYWLMARGLRSVRPQEAAMLTLLEPLLVPVWAYLVSGEELDPFTMIGGVCILGALVYCYWPWQRQKTPA